MKTIFAILMASATFGMAQPFFLVNSTNILYGPINRVPRSYDGLLVGVTNVPAPVFDEDTHTIDGETRSVDISNGTPVRVRITPVVRALTADEIELRRITSRIALVNDAIAELDGHRQTLTNSPSNAQVLQAVRFLADTQRDILRWIRRQIRQ